MYHFAQLVSIIKYQRSTIQEQQMFSQLHTTKVSQFLCLLCTSRENEKERESIYEVQARMKNSSLEYCMPPGSVDFPFIQVF